MAGASPSIQQQTHRPFPEVKLKSALLEFAPRYMKDKLQCLAQECDERLERDLVPRLLAVLGEIDQERHAFEQHRREATRDLRDHLNLLRFDDAAVRDAIAHLSVVSPKYLDLLPRTSSLSILASAAASVSASIPVSASASVSASSTAASPTIAFDTTEGGKSNQDADSHTLTPGPPAQKIPQDQTPQTKQCVSHPKPPFSFESQVQAQVMSENYMASPAQKRLGPKDSSESNAPSKRQKMADEKVASIFRLPCHHTPQLIIF